MVRPDKTHLHRGDRINRRRHLTVEHEIVSNHCQNHRVTVVFVVEDINLVGRFVRLRICSVLIVREWDMLRECVGRQLMRKRLCLKIHTRDAHPSNFARGNNTRNRLFDQMIVFLRYL